MQFYALLNYTFFLFESASIQCLNILSFLYAVLMPHRLTLRKVAFQKHRTYASMNILQLLSIMFILKLRAWHTSGIIVVKTSWGLCLSLSNRQTRLQLGVLALLSVHMWGCLRLSAKPAFTLKLGFAFRGYQEYQLRQSKLPVVPRARE